MAAAPIILFSALLLMGGAVLAHLIGAASILSFVAMDRTRFLCIVVRCVGRPNRMLWSQFPSRPRKSGKDQLNSVN